MSGPGEHHAALAVQVSGERVHHVDQPGGQRAELLGAGADAPVAGRPRRRRELAGQLADRLRRNARGPGHGLGRELAGQVAHGADAGGAALRGGEVDELLLEEHVDQGEQEEGVGAGTDRQVAIRHPRGLAPARVDHHEPPAPLPELAQASAHVGSGHEAAVALQRVGAEHQQVPGAVEVRDREGGHRAEHQAARDVLRELVDAGGGEAPLRAEGSQQRRDRQIGGEVVGVRVAQVGGDGVRSVGLADLGEPARHQLEGLVPADLDELVPDALDRGAQPIRVLREVAQGHRLRADVAPAHDVVLVAADVEDPAGLAVDGDGDAAVRLTEIAAPVHDVGVGLAHGMSSCRGPC